MALGICPKDKLFRGYIDLEIQLREFDRCRILYQKFLEFGPENCVTWMRVSYFFLNSGETKKCM
jgi:crooked neck